MITVQLFNKPTPFRLKHICGVLFASQVNGNVVIECEIPGAIADWIGPGCIALCTIAEGLLVIHEKVSVG